MRCEPFINRNGYCNYDVMTMMKTSFLLRDSIKFIIFDLDLSFILIWRYFFSTFVFRLLLLITLWLVPFSFFDFISKKIPKLSFDLVSTLNENLESFTLRYELSYVIHNFTTYFYSWVKTGQNWMIISEYILI